MPWSTIWPIVQLIWSAVAPSLKRAALDELKSIAAEHTGNIVLEAIISEAETLVAAA